MTVQEAGPVSRLSPTVVIADLSVPESCSELFDNPQTRGVLVRSCDSLLDFILCSDIDCRQRLDRWMSTAIADGRVPLRHAEKSRADLLSALTFVVCCHGKPPELECCLATLQRSGVQWPGIDEQAEILVIESAPEDDTCRQLCAEVPGVRYVAEPRPGLNFARNRAIEEARGELLAYIDPRVQLDAGWLDSLLVTVAEHPEAAAWCGQVLPSELETQYQLCFEQAGGMRLGFERCLYDAASRPGASYPCDPGQIGSAVNAVFRRSLLRQLWGFDEALDASDQLPAGGVMDVYYRLIRAGHSIAYDPAMLVFHRHPRERAELAWYYRYVRGKSRLAVAAKAFRTDHQNRFRLFLYTTGWFGQHSWELLRSVAGKHPIAPAILWGEWRGGVSGVLGAYRRSSKRVRDIKRRYPTTRN